MKNRKTELLLLVLGILCIGISMFMFHSNMEMEGKDKTEPDWVMENSEEDDTQALMGQESDKTTVKEKNSIAATTAIELEHDKPVQEINADMYEWPHENIWFEGYKEPDLVIYLAQRKELFDEFVATFQKYEGKDIYGVVGWDEEEQMVYYEPMFSKDIVAIYGKYEKFFREGVISSIDVNGDVISFHAVRNSQGYLHYYYDETRNEETDDFLDSNSIVHVAPHWWWREPAAPH